MVLSFLTMYVFNDVCAPNAQGVHYTPLLSDNAHPKQW